MNRGFEYLINRGVKEDTFKNFGAMYFADGVLHAEPTGIFTGDFFRMVKRNILTFTNEDNTLRMENCVLFPLLDPYLNYRSVFARKLAGTPKFDAMPFNKKTLLYGLADSYRHILNKDHVYIVEGIFDFLVMWQYGIRDVVSSLGSLLHYEQMCLLARFANNFTVIYDPDPSGKEGMTKAKELITKHGYRCSTVYLSEGLDVDDFILKYGVERLLKNAKTTLAI